MFAHHSWYFRNALVRANYKNYKLGINYDYQYLEPFFLNLLLGEHNELKNRYLIIDATDNWNTATPDVILKTLPHPASPKGGRSWNIKFSNKIFR